MLRLWQLGKSCKYDRLFHLDHHYWGRLAATRILLRGFARLILVMCFRRMKAQRLLIVAVFCMADAPLLDVVTLVISNWLRVVQVYLDTWLRINTARQRFAFTGNPLRVDLAARTLVKRDLLGRFFSRIQFIWFFIVQSLWLFRNGDLLFHYFFNLNV